MVKLYQNPPTLKGWRDISRNDRIQIFISDKSNDIYINVNTDEPEERIRLFIGREINFIKKQYKKRLEIIEAIKLNGLPEITILKQQQEAERLKQITFALFPFANFPEKIK